MMMAPPIPPNPEADAAAVGALPARPGRVAAAVLLDYLGFCVAWAAAHLLAIGPPPAWAAPPVFLVLEWFLVRHGRTPGMATLALARIPAGPGRFLWVADREPALRQNALSVLTGVLFLAGGLRLWALAVEGGAAPPPLFRVPEGGAGAAVALPWGVLSLLAGRAFLRLDPRAPLLGVLMLLATLASVALRPEAWGAWLVDGPAAGRALAGDWVTPARTAWLQAWLPVAAWLLCALAALAIALNRGPFRPVRPSPAGPP